MLFDGAAQLDVLVGGPADVRQALLGTLAAHRLGLRGRRARGRRQARGAAGHVRVRRVVVVPTRCRGAGWMLLAHGLVGEHIQRRDRRSLVHVHAQYTPAFRTAEHRRRERQLVVTHTAVPRGRASRAHIGLMVVRAERLCRMQQVVNATRVRGRGHAACGRGRLRAGQLIASVLGGRGWIRLAGPPRRRGERLGRRRVRAMWRGMAQSPQHTRGEDEMLGGRIAHDRLASAGALRELGAWRAVGRLVFDGGAEQHGSQVAQLLFEARDLRLRILDALSQVSFIRQELAALRIWRAAHIVVVGLLRNGGARHHITEHLGLDLGAGQLDFESRLDVSLGLQHMRVRDT